MASRCDETLIKMTKLRVRPGDNMKFLEQSGQAQLMHKRQVDRRYRHLSFFFAEHCCEYLSTASCLISISPHQHPTQSPSIPLGLRPGHIRALLWSLTSQAHPRASYMIVVPDRRRPQTYR